MKIRLTKNRAAFCLLAVLGLILAGCFQAVDTGETFIEKGTAHLRVNNSSADEAYVLEGLELRNAEGAVEQSWEGLDLSRGDTWEVHTETAGAFTLWYRVKDTWISDSAIDLWEGGPVEIALNRSHEFSFRGEDFEVSQEDADGDGLPDTWEKEHGFNPEDPGDGGTVYVSAGGQDEAPGNGTRSSPYKMLAKAVDKAQRGLTGEACTVVVLGTLDWQSGDDRNPENQARADSLFSLGKTRNPLTIRGEDPENSGRPGILRGELVPGKRILYLGPGAEITLLNMTITRGKHTGGGIYASGVKRLTLGPGTTITKNESYDVNASEAGGIYMERGVLVMEAGSLVTDNTAYVAGGVVLHASRLTMNGGKIWKNYGRGSVGGLSTDGCTIEMFAGAEISENEGGTDGDDKSTGRHTGGAAIGFSTLTMHQGSKIYKNTMNNGFAGGIYVTGESKLIMKADSEISGNKCINGTNNTGQGGGVMVAYKSSLIMEGGSISGNTADHLGGGVYLISDSSLTMKGGSISGNTAKSSGGGVFLNNGTSFTMTGGSVNGNRAEVAGGGGVCLGTSTFTMRGGDISGNTAKTNGGGIYLSKDASFAMQGGTVYGEDGGENKNKAEATSDPKGHAIYDQRSGTAVPYNDDVITFP